MESVEPDWLKRIVEKMDNQFSELVARLEGNSRKADADVKELRSEIEDFKYGIERKVISHIEENRATNVMFLLKVQELKDDIDQIKENGEETIIDQRVATLTDNLTQAINGAMERLERVEDQLNQVIENDNLERVPRDPDLKPEALQQRVSGIEDGLRSLDVRTGKNIEELIASRKVMQEYLEMRINATQSDFRREICELSVEARARGDYRLERAEENVHFLHNQNQEKTAALEEVRRVVEGLQTDVNANLAELSMRVDQVANVSQLGNRQDTLLPSEWFRDKEMGDQTLADFNLITGNVTKRKGKKSKSVGDKKKSKSKSKDGHGDPDDSDHSSSSSSDESDVWAKKGSRKRKDDSTASTVSSSTADDREDSLFQSKRFKTGNRRASIIGGNGDSESDEDIHHRNRRSSIIYVQPSPTVNDLHLDEVKIGKVLYFCKKFNNEDSKFRGGLHAANYISDRILSQMRQVAAKYNMPGKNGILRNGIQKIENEQIFAILAVMCAPTSLEAMQLELSKSSWPHCKHDYKDSKVIMRNIADYKTDMLIYIDRFEDKLILLRFHRQSDKYLPKTLFKKGGGNPGIADYFLGGMPDKGFGMRVWTSVDEAKRNRCKSWERFKKLYMQAIEAMEKREAERDINRQICLGVKEMIKVGEAQKAERLASRKRQSLHNLEEGGLSALSNGEQESADEIEIVFTKEENEELPSAVNLADDLDEAEEKESNLTTEDLEQLVNALQPADTRTVGVCYDMLYKGKCEKVNCPYSHKEEDIAKARKLRAVKFTSTPQKNSGVQNSSVKKVNQNLRRS